MSGVACGRFRPGGLGWRRLRPEDRPGRGEVPIQIEREAHAVDQGEEALGSHGWRQRQRHAAGPAVFEMDELGVVCNHFEGFPCSEVQALAEPGKLQQHGGKGLAGHDTSS
jgi:hypothetical protein